MRVIAGTARGVRLAAPRGSGTRPISDRVKETLFAILSERVPGARVLDLYAGSGAIGIEALSRGAARCWFVERGRDAIAALHENLERTRLAGSASVHPMAVDAFLARPPEAQWDIAVLDPPYAERDIVAPLEALAPRLALGATVVLKHFWRTEIPSPPPLCAVRQRRFGETTLTFLEQA